MKTIPAALYTLALLLASCGGAGMALAGAEVAVDRGPRDLADVLMACGLALCLAAAAASVLRARGGR